jgi:hypothetical protein
MYFDLFPCPWCHRSFQPRARVRRRANALGSTSKLERAVESIFTTVSGTKLLLSEHRGEVALLPKTENRRDKRMLTFW